MLRGGNGAYGGGECGVVRQHDDALAHAHFEAWLGTCGRAVCRIQAYRFMGQNLGLLGAAPFAHSAVG